MYRSRLFLVGLLALTLIYWPAYGDAWRFLGLDNVQVLSLTSSPSSPQVILAGTTQGLYVSFNGGQSWELKSATNVRVLHVEYDPYGRDTVYMLIGCGAFSDGLYKSGDDGASWQVVCYLAFPRRMTFDAVDTGYIYICFPNGILRSQDGGLSYAPALTGLPDTDIADVVAHGRTRWTAFAAGSNFIARTVDFGNLWWPMGGMFAFPDYRPNRLAVDPHYGDTLYACCRRYLARSYNGGNWTYTPLPDSDYTAIAFDWRIPGRIFIGSAAGGGVLQSTDGGITFAPMNDSLDNRNVHCLHFTSDCQLLAGTDDGVYIADMTMTGEQSAGNMRPDLGIFAYPNPFNRNVVIHLPVGGWENLRIYDIAGRLVRTIELHLKAASAAWDGQDDQGNPVRSGVYLGVVSGAQKRGTFRTTLLR